MNTHIGMLWTEFIGKDCESISLKICDKPKTSSWATSADGTFFDKADGRVARQYDALSF